MWYYGGMDFPFVDPSLRGFHGLGTWNYGLTQPTFGIRDTRYTVCDVNCNGILEKVALTDIDNDGCLEVLPINGIPYGTPQWGFSPLVNRSFHPFFRNEITPFFGLNTFTPQVWGSPIGFERVWPMNTEWGFKPWLTTGTFGYTPVEQIWKRSLGIDTPIYGQIPFFGQTPFVGPVGLFGTPYGIHNTVPFGFTGVEDRIKFNTPFGLYSPYSTPIDWKVKSFGTPVGMTTETWNKGVNFPWKTNLISGPVAVL